jgi:hypothetical protein
MLLKYAALLFQAILPTAMIVGVGHLTTLPRSEWSWLEYLIATPLTAFLAMTATFIVFRILLWLHSQAQNKYSNTS